MKDTIRILIREVREKEILVNTNSIEDALDTVEFMYSEGNFPLTEDDIEDVDFVCLEEDLED